MSIKMFDLFVKMGIQTVPEHEFGVVDVQNVSDYVDSIKIDNVIGDMPNQLYRSPFRVMWLEWKQQNVMRVSVLLAEFPESHDFNYVVFFSWDDGKTMQIISEGSLFHTEEKGYALRPKEPQEFYFNKWFSIAKHSKYGYEQNVEVAIGIMIVPIYSLAFLNCKNVTCVETPVSSKLTKARIRRGKPVYRSHTISIEPMKKVLKTAGKSESVGIAKAFHICRGHFKTYTSESPLFGRTTGTFFWPSHVKGSKSAGIIKKDYTIKLEDDR